MLWSLGLGLGVSVKGDPSVPRRAPPPHFVLGLV